MFKQDYGKSIKIKENSLNFQKNSIYRQKMKFLCLLIISTLAGKF